MVQEEKMVRLNDVAKQTGVDINWNKETKNVTFGGIEYTPQQLQSMGGHLTDGRWYLPQSVVQQMIPQQTPQVAQQRQPMMNPEMMAMQQMLQQMSNSHFEQQKAQLDMILQEQLAQLEMAYNQAIIDGKMSVREAEQQFEQQKRAIEEQAYQDAQRTLLYGHNMGINHSNQMIGLMQGDNARAQRLHSDNMSQRDMRINDINDRLNNITMQKNLNIASAHAQHGHGILSAQRDASQMYAQNMFGLMRDDYMFNRQAQHDINMFDRKAQHDMNMLYASHIKEIERMGIQFGYDLEKMKVGHQYNLEEISVRFKNDMELLITQFGHEKYMQRQAHANQLEIMSQQLQNQFALLNYQKDLARADLINTYQNPNSPEYIARMAEIDAKYNSEAQAIYTRAMAEATIATVINNPNLPQFGGTYPSAPKDYRIEGLPWWANIGGNTLNWVTGYNKKMGQHLAGKHATQQMEELIRLGGGHSGVNITPWATEEQKKLSVIDRLLGRY